MFSIAFRAAFQAGRGCSKLAVFNGAYSTTAVSLLRPSFMLTAAGQPEPLRVNHPVIVASRAPFFMSHRLLNDEPKPSQEIPQYVLPNADGSPPVSEKVLALVDAIVDLNVIESVQLATLLQSKLGISNEALFGSFGGGGGGSSAAEDAPVEAPKEPEAAPVQSTFTIKLASFEDGAKFKVLKEIRALKPGLSLTECKNLIDNLPSVLLEGADKDTVIKWTEAMQAVGAQVLTE